LSAIKVLGNKVARWSVFLQISFLFERK